MRLANKLPYQRRPGKLGSADNTEHTQSARAMFPYVMCFTLIALVSCARTGSETYVDARMQQSFDAGRSAYELGYLSQSHRDYEKAYQRALAVNDREGLQSAGYNLAVVDLRAHRVDAALRYIETTKRDLAARGLSASDRLLLTEAAAFYQVRDWGRAMQLACHIPRSKKIVGQRAQYFCGMSAVERGQIGVAAQELQDLQKIKSFNPRLRADQSSLKGRLNFAIGHFSESLAAAQKAADAAREAGDDDAMRAMLKLASLSAERLGKSDLARALALQMSQSAAAAKETAR